MERRVKETFKFEADGPEQPGPVLSFKIMRVTEHQRLYRGSWQADPDVVPAIQYQTAGRLSRDQLAALVADGVDWLRYIEEAGA